jgi:hypothetical protein
MMPTSRVAIIYPSERTLHRFALYEDEAGERFARVLSGQFVPLSALKIAREESANPSNTSNGNGSAA